MNVMPQQPAAAERGLHAVVASGRGIDTTLPDCRGLDHLCADAQAGRAP
jgi:hypothetical protein